MGELLTLEPPRPESVPSLSGIFDRVIGASSGYSWLPVEELMMVVSEQDASDRFIGGAADRQSETLALVRGNLATIVVPFAYFVESGDGTKPDFGATRARWLITMQPIQSDGSSPLRCSWAEKFCF